MPKYRVKFEGELYMLKKINIPEQAELDGWYLEMNDFGEFYIRKPGEKWSQHLGKHDSVKEAIKASKGMGLTT